MRHPRERIKVNRMREFRRIRKWILDGYGAIPSACTHYLWTFLLFLYFTVEMGKKLKRRPESTACLEQSQEDGTIERKGKSRKIKFSPFHLKNLVFEHAISTGIKKGNKDI